MKDQRDNLRAADRRWRERNPDASKKKALKWYYSNIEVARKRARERARLARSQNPEKHRLIDKRRSQESIAKRRLRCVEYGRRNKEKKRHYSAKRRAAKVGVKIEDVPEIKKIYARATFLRSVGFVVVVDHKTPLSKGGSHSPSNLQIIPQTENNRKYCNPDYQPIFIFP
jgi:5-methylcytosine-specific restriction endonuclease McrA